MEPAFTDTDLTEGLSITKARGSQVMFLYAEKTVKINQFEMPVLAQKMLDAAYGEDQYLVVQLPKTVADTDTDGEEVIKFEDGDLGWGTRYISVLKNNENLLKSTEQRLLADLAVVRAVQRIKRETGDELARMCREELYGERQEADLTPNERKVLTKYTKAVRRMKELETERDKG